MLTYCDKTTPLVLSTSSISARLSTRLKILAPSLQPYRKLRTEVLPTTSDQRITMEQCSQTTTSGLLMVGFFWRRMPTHLPQKAPLQRMRFIRQGHQRNLSRDLFLI